MSDISSPPAEIGFRGGYYCPIHMGHLITSDSIRAELKLEKVLLVTGAQPNHRKQLLAADDRHAMVEKAVRSFPFLEASRIELDRDGPSYTIDTVHQLQTLYPNSRINLIVGPEYLEPGARWHVQNWERGDELIKSCRIITHPRGGVVDLALVTEWATRVVGANIAVVDCPIIDVSSTMIRRLACESKPLDGLVPDVIVPDVLRHFGKQSVLCS